MTGHDLNNDRDMLNTVAEGEYDARHFIDFTGDGWIEASCPAIADTILHHQANPLIL